MPTHARLEVALGVVVGVVAGAVVCPTCTYMCMGLRESEGFGETSRKIIT
jgi:hypothetical protein